jgi:hypothetical protein
MSIRLFALILESISGSKSAKNRVVFYHFGPTTQTHGESEKACEFDVDCDFWCLLFYSFFLQFVPVAFSADRKPLFTVSFIVCQRSNCLSLVLCRPFRLFVRVVVVVVIDLCFLFRSLLHFCHFLAFVALFFV